MINRIILKVFTILDQIKQKAYLSASLKKGLKIGKNNNFIQVPDFGSEPYLIEIGNDNRINIGVRFITHDGAVKILQRLPNIDEKYKDIKNFARIKIGNNSFISLNCTLMPGSKIGDNCILGAGSILTSTMPDNCVYAGVPAKYICSIEEYAERALQKNTEFPRELDYDRKALDEYLKKNLPHIYKPIKKS